MGADIASHRLRHGQSALGGEGARARGAALASVVVTADPDVILGAGRVVFPGQGAAPDCMREIEARGLRRK